MLSILLNAIWAKKLANVLCLKSKVHKTNCNHFTK